MNKKIRTIILVFVVFGGLFISIRGWISYQWYHPHLYIEDFDSVSEDYNRVVGLLCDYYTSENCHGKISITIEKDYTLSYRDKSIDMDGDEKLSLKRICETSYTGGYDFIWLTEKDVTFWEGEAVLYALIYTKDIKKLETC